MADDLYYPDLSGDTADKKWVQSVRDAVRILFDSVYELGGRRGQQATFANRVNVEGDLISSKIGGTLKIAESGSLGTAGTARSDASMGAVKLDAGAATVLSTVVTQESRIFLTPQDGTSTGSLRVSARETGASFTITSSDAADDRTIAWLIVQPHGAADTTEVQVPQTESNLNEARQQRGQRDAEWMREWNRRNRTLL